ncbi:MAG: transposase family protein [Streptosporangiaceae bacterium]
MLPTEDLFVYLYVLIDDAIASGAIAIPPRPGPAPACSDAELLAVAMARHLLGRRSESGFLDEVARDWACLFPRLPHQCEANRRIPWLRGAFEQLRALLAGRLPEDDCQQIDTSAIPVKHTSRVRGPDQWTGPGNNLTARFGRDAAHAEWFYGFRLAIKTDLGSRIVRAWSIVPAAVNERDVGADCWKPGRRRVTCWRTRDSTARRSPHPRPPAVPPCWSRPPKTSAASCRRSCRRSSPNGVIGSRPPSRRSPTRWNWPATARTPSGAC